LFGASSRRLKAFDRKVREEKRREVRKENLSKTKNKRRRLVAALGITESL